MREMKDSGIEWIGNIPQEWSLKKLKYIASKIERGTAPNYTNVEMTRVVNQATFSKGYFDCSHIRFSTKPAHLSRGLLKKHDVLLASTGGGVLGKAHYFTESDEYVADGHVTITRVLPEYINSAFLYYFYSINFDTFNSMMAVGSTNQLELQRDLLANMIVPLPVIKEQDCIVTFLNTRCSELNALIADIQVQIDTLEQEKRSIISEAVTGKLMDNVEQADSGLNWARQLPKHWHTIPSKYLFHNSDLRKFHDDEQLTASQKYGIITQKQYMENEQAQIVLATQGLDKWKHVEPNDFIISLRSFQGGLEMSEITGCITWHYVVLKAAKPIVPRFYKWLFKSSVYINALQGTCNFIRDGQDLRFSNFAQVPLFEPPLEEQEQIANFLDVKCGEIDAIIAKKKEQLSVLADYKKSLIYEYVTGKKEVPLAVSDMAVAFDPHIIMLGIVIDKLGKEIRGKIQLQKMLYLMDEHIGLNRSTQYYRYAHGPYDLELDHYVEILVSNHWYEQKHQGADLLVPGKNHADFVKTYHDAFSDQQKEIDKLITFLKPMKTSQVERIATLYAAWNDFMIDGNVAPTDSQIIHEVMTNWTNNKANTKYSTWQGTLDKMKKNGIIPKGLGLHTLPKM